MIPRILEPEVMDTAEEARDYNEMDHTEVNRLFVEDLLRTLNNHGDPSGKILDLGTGTALIPIEICQQVAPPPLIVAVDLAEEMLKVARENIQSSGWEPSIRLDLIDAKRLPYPEETYAVVMSNSILHHIPEPLSVLMESWRVLQKGGVLFIRDLLRPESREQLEGLVAQYAGEESEHARQMFADSLHAALSIEEVADLCRQAGLTEVEINQTSDRHWTLSALKQ